MAFKYFGGSLDFCKRQISHLHPDLNIPELKIDAQLLEEKEKREEEKEKREEEKKEEEENKDKGEEKCDTSPISP